MIQFKKLAQFFRLLPKIKLIKFFVLKMISTSTQTNAPSTTMIEIQEGGPGYSCHIVLAKRSICRIDLFALLFVILVLLIIITRLI